ncbi:MAG: metal ABC transporter permease, partial [Candidatus Limnocylindria bacterium]
MPELLGPLEYGFMQRALLGAVVVAVVCASVGVFVVLRGLAFLGDAIAHAAFPGVVIAFLLNVNLVLGGAVAAVFSALAIGFVSRRAGLREDTVIGVVFSGMFALGIILFSGIRTYTGDLLGVLFGDVLAISEGRLVAGLAVGLAVLALLWLSWRELLYVSFDPTGAAAAGLPVVRYDALLLAVIGLTIAVAVQIVGVVLVVAMLVTPAAAARLLARDLRTMLALSIAAAALSAAAGIYASFYLNTASGGTVVLVATALFALAWLAR